MAYKVHNTIVIHDTKGPQLPGLYKIDNAYIDSDRMFYDSSAFSFISMDNVQEALDWLFNHRLTPGVAIRFDGNKICGDYEAGPGIKIAGDVISGGYVAGAGISIVGDTISGAYTGSNGVEVSGNEIRGDYKEGTAVQIRNGEIAGNYVGGRGIIITGNVISVDPDLYDCCEYKT